jgi:hypothetical protein
MLQRLWAADILRNPSGNWQSHVYLSGCVHLGPFWGQVLVQVGT